METAGASIDSRSDSGRTPLQVAAAMGRLVSDSQSKFSIKQEHTLFKDMRSRQDLQKKPSWIPFRSKFMKPNSEVKKNPEFWDPTPKCIEAEDSKRLRSSYFVKLVPPQQEQEQLSQFLDLHPQVINW